tara:strand:- start:955 stop:1233 length:279 start_codon:yes stop_codon:yes gene_type:complete
MKKVQLRRAIAKVLLGEKEPVTALHIYQKLEYKHKGRIKNAHTVASLIRGMKGIQVQKGGYNVVIAESDSVQHKQQCNLYGISNPNILEGLK